MMKLNVTVLVVKCVEGNSYANTAHRTLIPFPDNPVLSLKTGTQTNKLQLQSRNQKHVLA